jgi:hypothetical protein
MFLMPGTYRGNGLETNLAYSAKQGTLHSRMDGPDEKSSTFRSRFQPGIYALLIIKNHSA